MNFLQLINSVVGEMVVAQTKHLGLFFKTIGG